MSKIFITGMGVISAIGRTLAENHTALLQGQCGITKTGHFPARHADPLPFGEIPISTEVLQEQVTALVHSRPNAAPALPGLTPGTGSAPTRTHLLALLASQEAILDARLTPSQLNSFDTALVNATTVGGMCLMDELYRDASGGSGGNGGGGGSPYLSAYEAASVSIYLQHRYKINGIVNTINTACSSSANAIMYGARLIRNGLARRVIVGGVDSLSKFTINGFNALQILSPEICTPFDEHRKGLNLGEGAAFLVLEREEDLVGSGLSESKDLAGSGKKIYASISGYGNSNDAFHPSSLSKEGEGPYLAMKGALASAGLSREKIDFINAHGTGTENNDEVESRAMLRLFAHPPAFASTKSNIGHTLGASGAIEAVYSILNLVHEEIYAGLHFSQPIGETGLQPVTTYKKAALRHVMSNSFGFGGNCTSLIFSKA